MSGTQILLSYPEAGADIRSFCLDGVVYFSLSDVVQILASQNVQLANNPKGDGLFGMVRGLLDEVLEDDESREVEGHHYITEPGLFRLILRDNSQACKKFQRWVLHEVLPSIQKYGTYPPPLTKQDSDVKRLVQSLLLEIEEREKLERQTKEQFVKHERMLNNLSQKLTTISSSTSTANFYSVADYLQRNCLTEVDPQYVFGWCINICGTDGEPTQKRIVDGDEVCFFPEHVLNKALQNASK